MSFIFSQANKIDLTTITTESNTSGFIKIADLELNGINTSELISSISNEDLIKLRNFDFSTYRIYSASKKVQILDGPIIELYSIEKMISIGQNFDQNFIDSKKNIDYSTVTHEIIPLVNISFGKQIAPQLH